MSALGSKVGLQLTTNGDGLHVFHRRTLKQLSPIVP